MQPQDQPGGRSAASNSLVTFYYRTEGDSAVGILPTANPSARILRLDLLQCTGESQNINCPVRGTSPVNTPNDSLAGAVTKDVAHLGVTDVEPTQFPQADFPSQYNTAVYGNLTTAEMATLNTSPAFQQVFGIVVNTSGGAFTTPANLTRE